eukprot:PLAT6433.7.p1 GENE.PLAT6433.7~~PLAT6433.7.p1  ORF type:complete len:1917 (-),score=1127.16 PLAT6433.7:88-5337(-)
MFELFILTVIAVNTVSLAVANPLESKSAAWGVIDTIALVIFTAEAVLKIVAMGFIRRPHTYLRDNWNRLDFVVVVTGLLEDLVPALKTVPVLRALRVLRPLRALNYFRGMQVVLKSVTRGGRLLLNVLIVMLFFFVVFGIIGVENLGGGLRRRCLPVSAAVPTSYDDIPEDALFCAKATTSFGLHCAAVAANLTCVDTGFNPNNGLTSFDDIIHAFYTLFQITSLEGWSELMYWYMDAENYAVFLFFVFSIFFGTFLVLNLSISVIVAVFSNAWEEYEEEMEAERAARAEQEGREIEDAEEAAAKALVQERQDQYIFARITRSAIFNNFIIACILVNTVFLAAESDDQTEAVSRVFWVAELTFTIIFTVEIVIKTLGLHGFRNYLKDNMNKFDFVIVLISVFFLVLDISNVSSGGLGGLSTLRVLRIFRVLRFSRLFYKWKRMKMLLDTALASSVAMLNLTALIAFSTVCGAILGMQLFGGVFPKPTPRVNFDSFGSSVLTLFIITTGEDWNAVFYDAMTSSSSWAAPFFLIGWFIYSNYILVNLFIAVILENFEIAEEAKKRFQEKVYRQELLILGRKTKEELGESDDDSDGAPPPIPVAQRLANWWAWLQGTCLCRDDHDRALWCLPRSFFLRRACLWLTAPSPYEEDSSQPWWKRTTVFDSVILLSICVSAGFLAAESVALRGSTVFIVADNIFLIIFAFEFVVKVIALGFWSTPQAYIRDRWNALDGFVLAVSILNFLSQRQLLIGVPGWARVLRLGRTLRPLRMVNRNKGLKTLVDSLLDQLAGMVDVGVLVCAFFLVFAILARNLFGGKFASCNDGAVAGRLQCVGTFIDASGQNVTREWSQPTATFDTLGAAFQTLLEVATLEGWIDVMHNSMDVTEEGMQPRQDASPEAAIYFIIFIFVCAFVLLNLFVGVVLDNFSKAKGTQMMTEGQRKWTNLELAIDKSKPTALPRLRTRGRSLAARLRVNAYNLALNCNTTAKRCGRSYHGVHKHFDQFIMLCIVLNTVVMMMVHNPMGAAFRSFIDTANLTFLIIFAVEMALKLVALGFKGYIADRWNAFDGAIVLGSSVTLLFAVPFGAQVARVFRISRLVRVIRGAQVLRILFNTMYVSLPQLGDVTLITLLLFFVYAIVGMELYGDLGFPGRSPLPLDELDGIDDRYSNFHTFGNSMLLLFRMATGENWQLIMQDAQKVSPEAPLYFVSFVIVGAFIFFNFYLGSVLDNFEYCYSIQRSKFMGHEDLETYKHVWSQFDPDGSGHVPLDRLREFLRVLAHPPPRVLHKRSSFLSRASTRLRRMSGATSGPRRTDFQDYLGTALKQRGWFERMFLEMEEKCIVRALPPDGRIPGRRASVVAAEKDLQAAAAAAARAEAEGGDAAAAAAAAAAADSESKDSSSSHAAVGSVTGPPSRPGSRGRGGRAMSVRSKDPHTPIRTAKNELGYLAMPFTELLRVLAYLTFEPENLTARERINREVKLEDLAAKDYAVLLIQSRIRGWLTRRRLAAKGTLPKTTAISRARAAAAKRGKKAAAGGDGAAGKRDGGSGSGGSSGSGGKEAGSDGSAHRSRREVMLASSKMRARAKSTKQRAPAGGDEDSKADDAAMPARPATAGRRRSRKQRVTATPPELFEVELTDLRTERTRPAATAAAAAAAGGGDGADDGDDDAAVSAAAPARRRSSGRVRRFVIKGRAHDSSRGSRSSRPRTAPLRHGRHARRRSKKKVKEPDVWDESDSDEEASSSSARFARESKRAK